MAKKEEIEITIGNDGEVELHVTGVPGSDCMKLTEELENLLGVVVNREKTSEYYQEKDESGIHISNDTEKGSA